MLDLESVAERVATGAELLDIKYPGWHRLVNNAYPIDGDSMAYGRGPCGCILARVYGSYFDGEDVLSATESVNLITHGFNADFDRVRADIPEFNGDEYEESARRQELVNEEFDALAGAWRFEVRWRVSNDAGTQTSQ